MPSKNAVPESVAAIVMALLVIGSGAMLIFSPKLERNGGFSKPGSLIQQSFYGELASATTFFSATKGGAVNYSIPVFFDVQHCVPTKEELVAEFWVIPKESEQLTEKNALKAERVFNRIARPIKPIPGTEGQGCYIGEVLEGEISLNPGNYELALVGREFFGNGCNVYRSPLYDSLPKGFPYCGGGVTGVGDVDRITASMSPEDRQAYINACGGGPIKARYCDDILTFKLTVPEPPTIPKAPEPVFIQPIDEIPEPDLVNESLVTNPTLEKSGNMTMAQRAALAKKAQSLNSILKESVTKPPTKTERSVLTGVIVFASVVFLVLLLIIIEKRKRR